VNPVLVVIDGPFERAEVERVLGTEFKVTTTEDSAGALRALAGRAFDAVVIDLELRGENAQTVHEFLMQVAPRLAERAVIFGSGARDSQLSQWALGFGKRYVRREDIFGLLDVVREVASAEWQS
jgi:DNA-binding NarL/FixJ family response regulator